MMIVAENIHKSFGPKKVLQGISLSVSEGESLVIIGGSGTGKSVFLKCLLGLYPVNQGSFSIDGKVLKTQADFEEILKKIGMLFQGSALFDSLTVWENVAFSLLQTLDRSVAKEEAVKHLESVGLEPAVADLFPAEISGGMQRRVGLARAIASRPSILFCDEPTAGLDPIFSARISDLIRTSVDQLGATAITITHDMKCARTVGDKILMLHEGKVVWYGITEELDSTDNPYVRQFVHGEKQGPIQI